MVIYFSGFDKNSSTAKLGIAYGISPFSGASATSINIAKLATDDENQF